MSATIHITYEVRPIFERREGSVSKSFAGRKAADDFVERMKYLTIPRGGKIVRWQIERVTVTTERETLA